MILLVNTFITETKPAIGKGFVFRENLGTFSNFDIFKYSLSSFAVAYKWSKVLLYIELDQIYKHRQAELEAHIREEFAGFEVDLRWERNYYQEDWKKVYDLLDNNLIWFYCNHDHIFVDSDSEYLAELVDKMRGEELCSLQFSHWPENIRTAKQGGAAPPKDPSTYSIEEDHVVIQSENFDSIQIITKELYRRWWFEGEFNSVKLPRPDYFGIGLAELKPMPVHKLIIPLKELCRHFDGYQHIYPPITNYQCPAIDIPEGFFEKKMKVRFGYEDRKEGWTNVNPLATYYYAYDTSGTDYKYTMEDLPLVWHKRISEVDINPDLEDDQILQFRFKSILEMMYTDLAFPIDDKVKDKVIALHLKSFPKYSLDV